MNIIPKCPNCSCTRVQFLYKTSTLMGYAQIINNGEVESRDPNWHTSYYTCCECHHRFHIRERYGEIEEIEDDGTTEVVPIADIPISVTGETSTDTLTINVSNEYKNQIKYQWELDIEELQHKVKEIQTELDQLKEEFFNEHN